MRHYTYVMFSPSRYQYFVGHTDENPDAMVNKHNAGRMFSTKKGTPWQLVFSKQFESSVDSFLFAKKLDTFKTRNCLRHFIEQLSHEEVL